MAKVKGVELASAYISLSVNTDGVPGQIKDALGGSSRDAEKAGRDTGQKFTQGAKSALASGDLSKALARELGAAGDKGSKELLRSLSATNTQAQRNLQNVGRNYATALQSAMNGGGQEAAVKWEGEFRKALNARNASQQYLDAFQADSVARGERVGQAVGKVIGGALSLGITAAAGVATAAVGGIGYSLFKGFDRYKSLDATNKRLRAMGKSGDDVKSIVGDINDVVSGTPIALDEAASAATKFLQGGVKQGAELKGVLTAIADASGASGESFGDLATIFGQVMNKGKLQAEEMMQLNERNINIQAALRQEFGWTGDQLNELSQSGQITFQQLLQAVEGNFGGMAKAAGDTVDGAIGNMQAAAARVGSNFLAALFGDPLASDSGPGGMAQAINNVTGKINQLGVWVQAHQGDIRGYFEDGVSAAKAVADVVGDVAGFLREHPGLVKAAAEAFVVFKGAQVLGSLAALATSLSTVGKGLDVLPGKADKAATGMSAALSRVAIPAWLAFLVYNEGKDIFDNATKNDSPYPGVPTASDPTGQKGMQNRTTGGTVMGVPSYANDSAFQSNHRSPTGSREPGWGGAPGRANLGALGDDFFLGGQSASSSAAQPAGSGVERWRGTFSSVLNKLGLPQEPWLSLGLKQMQTESGGDPTIQNNWDSNAAKGTPSIGLMQTIQPTFDAYLPPGFASDIRNPESNIAAAVMYTLKRYGGPQKVWGKGVGYASGGSVWGAGSATSDSIPALLSNGEHVLTAKDVAAMGGQAGVYAFRNMLHAPGFDQGGQVWPFDGMNTKYDPNDPRTANSLIQPSGPKAIDWNGYQDRAKFDPRMVIDTSTTSVQNVPQRSKAAWTMRDLKTIIQQKDTDWNNPVQYKRRNIRLEDPLWQFIAGGSDGNKVDTGPSFFSRGGVVGFAGGGEVSPEQMLLAALADPGNTEHGQAQGAPPGPQQPNPSNRTGGYIPATAGNTAPVGQGGLSSILGLGESFANNAIDMAAQAGSMGANAFAPGSGVAVQMGAQAGKRLVQYGFDLAGIWGEALPEIFMPFGVPRWLGSTDPMAFMPQTPGQQPGQQTPGSAAAQSIQSWAQPGNPAMANGTGQEGAQAALSLSKQQPSYGQPPAQPVSTPPAPVDPLNPATWLQGAVFDSGGMLQPGQVGINLSNRPEAVFTGQQFRDISKMATGWESAPSRQGGDTNHFYAQDVDGMFREYTKNRRRESRQYSGRP